MIKTLKSSAKFLNAKVLNFLCALLCVSFSFSVSQAQVIDLVFPDGIYSLDLEEHSSIVTESSRYDLKVGNQAYPVDFDERMPPDILGFNWDQKSEKRVDAEALKKWLMDQSLHQTSLEQVNSNEEEVQKPTIGYDKETESVTFTGTIDSNQKVEIEELVNLMNFALQNDRTAIRVSVKKEYSAVEVDPALQARGIKEVVAVGTSNFKGSSKTRIHNIKTAMKQYNGYIVKKGETFSFNGILKSVSPELGYKEELVIKGDTTEKEFGGGVCQVSSTVYRAAFNGGLPITKRRNHSYAVSYYQPYGMDATIYLGSQDFKFDNDTPGDLLLQTYMEGNDLYFVFYGTHDDREVVIEGPFISNKRKAPSPKYIVTDSLPPGHKNKVGDSHDGFRAEWVRKIKPANSNTFEREVWPSNYRAWPAKIMVGRTPTPPKPAPVAAPVETSAPTSVAPASAPVPVVPAPAPVRSPYDEA